MFYQRKPSYTDFPTVKDQFLFLIIDRMLGTLSLLLIQVTFKAVTGMALFIYIC